MVAVQRALPVEMNLGLRYAVCTMFVQGTTIGSLDSVEMLFKFIKPLVEEGEDDDEMDEEVRPLGGSPINTVWVAPITPISCTYAVMATPIIRLSCGRLSH